MGLHDPPYGLFAVVTFMPRGHGNSKGKPFAIIAARESKSDGSRDLFIIPTKRRRAGVQVVDPELFSLARQIARRVRES